MRSSPIDTARLYSILDSLQYHYKDNDTPTKARGVGLGLVQVHLVAGGGTGVSVTNNCGLASTAARPFHWHRAHGRRCKGTTGIRHRPNHRAGMDRHYYRAGVLAWCRYPIPCRARGGGCCPPVAFNRSSASPGPAVNALTLGAMYGCVTAALDLPTNRHPQQRSRRGVYITQAAKGSTGRPGAPRPKRNSPGHSLARAYLPAPHLMAVPHPADDEGHAPRPIKKQEAPAGLGFLVAMRSAA